MSKRKKGRRSYQGAFEEVDVGVPPIIQSCVNGTRDPWETLRDEPWIAVSLWVLSECPVILIVIPPELSTCTHTHTHNIHQISI